MRKQEKCGKVFRIKYREQNLVCITRIFPFFPIFSFSLSYISIDTGGSCESPDTTGYSKIWGGVPK
jgi:hypothetical protein